MAPKTREQLRAEAGERRVNPASLVSNRDTALAAEAERLREESAAADQEADSPAQEAEREATGASGTGLVAPNGDPARQIWPGAHEDRAGGPSGLIQRFRASRAPKGAPEAISGPSHSVQYASLIESAYQDFVSRGHEPETARVLTQAYALAELAGQIAEIGKKL